MIEIKNLKKTYFKGKRNEIKVINDTTLSLPDRGLVSFLGPSGSGKTTLLNTIGGLDKADSGTISYDGNEEKKYKMEQVDKYRRSSIGYVFQNYLLIDNLSVYENLRLALEINDITDDTEVSKRIESALKAVGMYKFRKKPAGALSGGQQQRVSIARALVKKCKVIIADEPTGNLDSENTIEVMNILKKISETSLVLLVTHNVKIAEFYSDKIVSLKDGCVLEFKENTSSDALDLLSDGDIHLLDYKEEKNEISGVPFTLYTDAESKKDSITIVIRNNTVYIDSDSRIEVVKDSGTKLLNDHKKALKKEDLESFAYDNSWYSEGKRKNVFLSFFKDLGNSFHTFFQSPKKKKVFNVIFAMIGILLAVLVLFQSNYMAVDESSLAELSDEDVYTLIGPYGKYFYMGSGLAESSSKEGYITNVFDRSYDNVSSVINSKKQKTCAYYSYHYTLSYIENEKLIAGEIPTEADSVVLGKKLADDILESFGSGFTYQDLIGLRVNSTKQIAGISSKNTRGTYEILDMHRFSYYSVLTTPDLVTYKVESGRDIQDFGEILIPKSKEDVDNNYTIGGTVNHDGIEFTIVGTFTKTASKDSHFNDETEIVNDKSYFAFMLTEGNYSYNAVFELGNLDTAETFFEKYSFTYENAYKEGYSELLTETQGNKKTYFIIEAVLFAIIIIYTYFSERSKMISEVHDIGVLRSLGARRHRLISKSLKDIFAKATMTTLLGYLAVLVVYYYIAARIDTITGTNTLSFNFLYTLGGLVLLYLSELIIGIIPMALLLRKTPSEINSKYDI